MLTATFINGPFDNVVADTLQAIADRAKEKALSTGDPIDVAAWEKAQYAADRARGGSAGTAPTPTTPPTSSPGPSVVSGRPVYKKWQFWAAIGGATTILGLSAKLLSR